MVLFLVRSEMKISMTHSLMQSEILQASQVLERLYAEAAEQVQALARQIVTDDARICVTVARGSSDHAAHHFSALMARMTGRFVASMPPSWTAPSSMVHPSTEHQSTAH
jgi:fructoselysine-6-P-deglycase FrlB-like protein